MQKIHRKTVAKLVYFRYNQFMSQYQIKIIKQKRKTLVIEITDNANVLVKAPETMSQKSIEDFLVKKEEWIIYHIALKQQQLKMADFYGKLTEEETQFLIKKARTVLPERANYYASILHVDYHKITIRKQHTRWGSCSSKGNLNFNYLLMLSPDDVINYVVVHELCHRIEMNHSKNFWKLVASVLPDYQTSRAWLKKNGSILMQRGFS